MNVILPPAQIGPPAKGSPIAVCHGCGLMVGDVAKHNNWHRKVEEAITSK